MNLRYRTIALLMIGLSLSAFVAPAVAAGPKNALLFAPGEPYGLPKFGFSGSNINGYGERVVFVRLGGRASQLGLEPGDVILSLNGYRLTYSGSWNDALSRALTNGGFVQLHIRDVRTGSIRVRQTYVGYGNGPIEHYSKPEPHFNVTNTGIHVIK